MHNDSQSRRPFQFSDRRTTSIFVYTLYIMYIVHVSNISALFHELSVSWVNDFVNFTTRLCATSHGNIYFTNIISKLNPFRKYVEIALCSIFILQNVLIHWIQSKKALWEKWSRPSIHLLLSSIVSTVFLQCLKFYVTFFEIETTFGCPRRYK